MNVRVNCEKSNHTSASKSTKDEEADDQVVPAGCLHGLVLEPWLLIFALESVALEDSLRAHVGVCLVEALDGLIWCGTIEMAGIAAILVATDGCRSRHCDGVDVQAQVMWYQTCNDVFEGTEKSHNRNTTSLSQTRTPRRYQVEFLMAFWPCQVRRLRRQTRPTENKVTATFGELY